MSSGIMLTTDVKLSADHSKFRRPLPGCRLSLKIPIAWLVALLAMSGSAQSQTKSEPTLLPFVTTDSVLRKDHVTGRIQRTAGVIENLTGNIIEIRRGGRQVERISLDDVTELQFLRSLAYEEGLASLQKNDFHAAIRSFEAARTMETRSWVICEIRASMAMAMLATAQFEEVIKQVEEISRLDPGTRHVTLLPLVWDERLPKDERCQSDPEDLKSASPARQLTAASSLLHDPQYQNTATDILTRLRSEGKPFLRELAEAQLWRLKLKHPERLRKADTTSWKTRTQEWSRDLRAGPEFLLGRGLLLQNDFDGAAMSFLWMPTMSPYDPAMSAFSLKEASAALQLAGRHTEAERVRSELITRFPGRSAATTITNEAAAQ